MAARLASCGRGRLGSDVSRAPTILAAATLVARRGRDLLEAARREHAQALIFGNDALGLRVGVDVALLDQEPALALKIVATLEPHQRPSTLQLLTVEAEFDLALAIARLDIGHRHPGAVVPHHHRAAAVLTLGDVALEVGVIERMVLDVDGEAPHLGIEARPLGDRPALEDPADLEPEVVVERAGAVFLDHEPIAAGDHPARLGLGRAGEIALAAIGRELALAGGPTSRAFGNSSWHPRRY